MSVLLESCFLSQTWQIGLCVFLILAFLSSFSFRPSFSFQAKVRELEEKCRTQSEQFNLLSKELEKFRLQAGKLDILSSSQLTGSDSPSSPTKPLTLSQLLNGLTAPSGKGTVRAHCVHTSLHSKQHGTVYFDYVMVKIHIWHFTASFIRIHLKKQ